MHLKNLEGCVCVNVVTPETRDDGERERDSEQTVMPS